MSKQLPMAIKPSIIPTEQCNFQLIKIPNSEQSVGYIFRNLVIEVNSKTIHADVAYLLGIGEGWCTEYIGGKNNYTYCQYPADGFHYRKNIYKGSVSSVCYSSLLRQPRCSTMLTRTHRIHCSHSHNSSSSSSPWKTQSSTTSGRENTKS